MELNANYNNRATTPLPLGRAIRELSGQYVKVLTTVLFGVPFVILSYLLFLIPVAGVWLIYTPHIYSIVLLLLALKAVHHFGKVEA